MHKAYLNTGRRNEIILSAGAMGSTQQLMLSGVRLTDHLHSFNTTLVLNQSAVGQGMGDSPMNAIFVPSPTVQLRRWNDDPPPPAVDEDDDAVGDPRCLDDEPTTTAPAALLCPCPCTCCSCCRGFFTRRSVSRRRCLRLAARCRAGERLLLGRCSVTHEGVATQLA
ncbi:hypothetical protein ZWY2020_016815 [Hordeum vulgare]|nr:hypothetical protein ZWY2020_016815 [Hordeum vulgare]